MNAAEAAIAGLFNQKGSGGGGSVAEAIISATSTTSPITDSANVMVQGITIYGRSEVVDGSIVSVGEGWATVDLSSLTWAYSRGDETRSIFLSELLFEEVGSTDIPKFICNKFKTVTNASSWQPNEISQSGSGQHYLALIVSPSITTPTDLMPLINGVILCYKQETPTTNTLAIKTDDGTGNDGTMAAFTTALPLRGVSDTVRDKLTCTAESKQVETVCEEVDLGTLTWGYDQSNNQFYSNQISNAPSGGWTYTVLCSKYVQNNSPFEIVSTPHIRGINDQRVYIVDPAYSDVATFTTAVTGVKLVYPLATPTVTPLTSTEISAFRALRTFDGTTNITISDDPEFEIDYLKNTENGEAVGKIQDDLQGQINGLAIKTLTYTGTGTTTNSITFPEKPLMVLGYTQDSDYDTFVRGIMPFFFHPSTAMLRIFWKGKSETSHASDYTYSSSYVLTINGNSISWIGLDASQALNSNGVEYTLYYI